MNKAKQGFRINLTTRKTESLKKFLSTVLASVMVFYMCSINLLTVELMTARADELNDKAGSSVTSSSDSNSNSDSPSNSNDNSKNENANSDDKVSETPKDDNSNKNDNFKVNDSNSNENTNADSVSSESSQTVQPDTPADNGETPAQDSNTNDNQSGTPTQDNLGNPTVNPTASDSATTIANDNVVLDTTVTAPVPQENGDLNTFVAPNTKASSVDLDSINPENISTAKLATDKADYYSTDTAIITGTGFIPGQTYILKISSSDTPPTSKSVEVTADENGQFVYAYQLDGTYRPDYTVVAKNTDGDVIAKTSFTDPAAPTTTTMNSLSTPIVAGSTGNAWSGSVTPAGITNVDVELRYVSSSASCPDGTGGPGSDGTKLTTPAPVKTSNSTFSGTFTAPAAGTYKFFAKFKGNPSYAKSYSTCQTITVNASGKIAQSITFGALSDKTYGNADFTVSATATSGLPVSFSESGDCSVSGTTVHITGAGSCTITASQSGNGSYDPAPDVSQSFNIAKASSTTAVTCPASETYTGSAIEPCTVSVTGAGGLSLTPNPAYTGNTNVGTASASYTYAGDANHTGSSDSSTFNIIDTTPPVITKDVSGTVGSNGWYTSDVTVTWTVTDPESGVMIDSGCGTQNFASETAGDVSSCTAHSAGGTASDSVGFKIDKTGPSANLAVTAGTLGDNDWYKSDVTISTSGTDSISGPATCTANQFQTAETTGQVFNGQCTNDAGLITDAVPLTIKLDKTEPVTTITSATDGNAQLVNPGGTTNSNEISVEFNAVDANGIASSDCRIDSGGYGACTSPISFPSLADGSHTVYVRSTDLAGNVESTAIFTWTIDTTAPSIPTGGTPNATYINTNNFDFNWDASTDDTSAVTYEFQSSLDPTQSGGVLTTGVWPSGTLPTNAIHSSGAPDGTWYWQVRAIDAYGNTSAWSEVWNVTIDTHAPTIDAHADVTEEATSSSGATVTYTVPATHDAIDGDGAATCLPTSGEIFPLGGTTVNCTATDTAGNSATPTSFVVHVEDTTAPAVPQNPVPADNAYINTHDFTFSWDSVTDLSSPVTYEWEFSYSPDVKGDSSFITRSGFHGSLTSPSIASPGTPDNIYYWHVRAIDTVGNASLWTTPWKVTVDTVAPTVGLIFSTPGPSATSFQAVFSEDVNQADAENPANYFLNNWPGAGGSGDLMGDATVAYDSLSKTATITFTNPGWYVSPEQQWGVQNISDLAGNIQSVNPYSEYSTPMVAPTDPGTPTTVPNPTDSITQTWNWAASSDPGGSGVKGYYSSIYDVTSSTPGSWTWLGNVITIATNLLEGQYQLWLKAEDNAGNQSNVVKSDTLTVDTTKPVTSDSGTDADWHNTDVTVTLTCDDGVGSGCSETYYTTNGTDPTTSSTTGNTVTLDTDGIYTIKYFSVDNAGNAEDIKTASNQVKIDTTKPESAITSPANSGSGSTININTWTGAVAGTAADSSGGSGMAGVTISIKKGADQYWNGTSFETSATEILVDANYSGGSWQYNGLTNPTDDTYTITSHAVDIAGNQESSYKLIIVSDKTIPEVSLTINPTNPDGQNGWYVSKPQVTLSANDNAAVDKI